MGDGTKGEYCCHWTKGRVRPPKKYVYPMSEGVCLALAEIHLDCCGISVAIHCYILHREALAVVVNSRASMKPIQHAAHKITISNSFALGSQ